MSCCSAPGMKTSGGYVFCVIFTVSVCCRTHDDYNWASLTQKLQSKNSGAQIATVWCSKWGEGSQLLGSAPWAVTEHRSTLPMATYIHGRLWETGRWVFAFKEADLKILNRAAGMCPQWITMTDLVIGSHESDPGRKGQVTGPGSSRSERSSWHVLASGYFICISCL